MPTYTKLQNLLDKTLHDLQQAKTPQPMNTFELYIAKQRQNIHEATIHRLAELKALYAQEEPTFDHTQVTTVLPTMSNGLFTYTIILTMPIGREVPIEEQMVVTAELQRAVLDDHGLLVKIVWETALPGLGDKHPFL